VIDSRTPQTLYEKQPAKEISKEYSIAESMDYTALPPSPTPSLVLGRDVSIIVTIGEIEIKTTAWMPDRLGRLLQPGKISTSSWAAIWHSSQPQKRKLDYWIWNISFGREDIALLDYTLALKTPYIQVVVVRASEHEAYKKYWSSSDKRMIIQLPQALPDTKEDEKNGGPGYARRAVQFLAFGFGFHFAWMLDDGIRDIMELKISVNPVTQRTEPNPEVIPMSSMMKELENIVNGECDQPNIPLLNALGSVNSSTSSTLSVSTVTTSHSWLKCPSNQLERKGENCYQPVTSDLLPSWVGHRNRIGGHNSFLLFFPPCFPSHTHSLSFRSHWNTKEKEVWSNCLETLY
jgi:hypothetical protein